MVCRAPLVGVRIEELLNLALKQMRLEGDACVKTVQVNLQQLKN